MELVLLRARLTQENEVELLNRIKLCQEPLKLICLSCRHKKTVRQRCKKRWCPCCARQLAAARADELEYLVERMRWPLFVTLTMRHSSTVLPADITTLRRAFGRLRHQKLWKSRTQGGAATVELTNQEGGWHPHLHAVIDCEWLAVKEPRPAYRASAEEKRAAYKRAAVELGTAWAKLLKQPTASVRVKRAYRGTIGKEVSKYTVKAQDLIQSTTSPGDIIRALDRTRSFTTFGHAHGQKCSQIRKASKDYAKQKRASWVEAKGTPACCPADDYVLEPFADAPGFLLKTEARRRTGAELRARELACVAVN